jgi:hypothetical protein
MSIGAMYGHIDYLDKLPVDPEVRILRGKKPSMRLLPRRGRTSAAANIDAG